MAAATAAVAAMAVAESTATVAAAAAAEIGDGSYQHCDLWGKFKALILKTRLLQISETALPARSQSAISLIFASFMKINN